ncbi:hypothetical protein V1477_013466 [Vespula maculifrons]|uniref:Uncharacterized protein n=1 Tax=Vespula maculifrons TaxID=7453 RepID=A0ABD2BQI2_VESMC
MLYRDSRLREKTTKSGLGPTLTVTSSVELWTSTRELRNFRGCLPCKLKCRLGILGFERRQQSTVLDRPLQLLVQLSFGLRRENLEIFADTIHASINEQLIQIYNSFFDFSLKYRVGIVGLERRRQSTTQMQIRDTRFRETTTKYGLGPTFTVTSSVEHWTPTRELRNLRGCHPCNRLRETTTKSGLGPTFTVTSSVELWTPTRELRNLRRCHPFGFERRQQSRVLDRPLQLLLIQIYNSVFGCGLKCRVGIVGFGRRQQIRVLERPLLLLVQLSFGLRRENLEIFADAIHASINEQLIQTYDGIFGFRLKCRVGILAFERRRLCRVLDLPLKLLVQLSFGLRRENLEIFVDAFHASINEQLIQTYYGIFGLRLKCSVGILDFERRRQSRVLDRPLQLKCYIGIVGFERRQQSRVLDRPLQLLVQLSFGLRRENLEIFVDAFHATINEQLIQIYNSLFGFRLKCRIKMLYRDSRLREKTTKSGLGPTLTVTSSVELWTSTRELRNFRGCHPCNRLRETTTKSGLGPTFTVTTSVVLWISTRELRNYRGCHPCKLKCYIGIVGFERRQQSRVLDRPLQLLLLLCFGFRRENLEIFADAIHASINEQLIQIHDSIFGFRLKCRIKMLYRDSRLRQKTTKSGLGPTLTVTSSVELWTSTRELRNIRGCHPCKHKCRVEMVAFERRRQSRVLDRTFQLLLQLCFGLRRENLEIFADAIHASINEQLIQIHDSIFGFRLKCRIKMLYRDSRLREKTTKSGLGPTLTVTSSVELWTSTRELRNFRGCHPCNRLRETTTKSGLGPTFTVTTSVVLWISTRELRNYRGCNPCKDSRLRETTTKSGLGPTFTVTSSVELWTSTRELRNLCGCHPCKY